MFTCPAWALRLFQGTQVRRNPDLCLRALLAQAFWQHEWEAVRQAWLIDPSQFETSGPRPCLNLLAVPSSLFSAAEADGIDLSKLRHDYGWCGMLCHTNWLVLTSLYTRHEVRSRHAPSCVPASQKPVAAGSDRQRSAAANSERYEGTGQILLYTRPAGMFSERVQLRRGRWPPARAAGCSCLGRLLRIC